MNSNQEFLRQLKSHPTFQEAVKNGICECCGEINPYCIKLYESHHESTREFPDKIISLCYNCHGIVTAHQNKFPPYKRSRKLPLELRIPFILASHSALRARMEEIQLRLFTEEIICKK